MKATQNENLAALKRTLHSDSPVRTKVVETSKKTFEKHDLTYKIRKLEVTDRSEETVTVEATQVINGPDYKVRRVVSVNTLKKEGGQWKLWGGKMKSAELVSTENMKTKAARTEAAPEESPKSVIRKNVRATQNENLALVKSTFHSRSPIRDKTINYSRKIFRRYDLTYKIENIKVVNRSEQTARVKFTLITRKVSGPKFRDNRTTMFQTLKKENGKWKIWKGKTVRKKYLDMDAQQSKPAGANAGDPSAKPSGSEASSDQSRAMPVGEITPLRLKRKITVAGPDEEPFSYRTTHVIEKGTYQGQSAWRISLTAPNLRKGGKTQTRVRYHDLDTFERLDEPDDKSQRAAPIGSRFGVAPLPLEPGYEETVSGGKTRVEVTGEEAIETPAGRLEAYVVQMRPVDSNGYRATIYARKQFPHYALKGTVEAKGGMTIEIKTQEHDIRDYELRRTDGAPETEESGTASETATESDGAGDTASCIGLKAVRASTSAGDLIGNILACTRSGKYQQAARLQMVGLTLQRYDAERVEDKTAHGAFQAKMGTAFKALPESTRKTVLAEMKTLLKNAEARAPVCERLQAIGPPTYQPAYMVAHGMGAMTEKMKGGDVAYEPPTDFDAEKAWMTALEYANCTDN
ncbi:MAG: hypothetical protein ABEL04_05230 [Salinibacter sp.]|uniref:hypothetical protein n=1 Tax=Salinibacter sp. TaxID=2065818 RepID=UPI0035D404D3